MKKYGKEIPQLKETNLSYGMIQLTLNYYLKESTKEDIENAAIEEGVEVIDEEFIENHKFNWYSVQLAPTLDSRDAQIDAIITDRYPLDRMQAIQNNWLYNPNNSKYKNEWEEMQSFRKYAKQFVDSIS